MALRMKSKTKPKPSLKAKSKLAPSKSGSKPKAQSAASGFSTAKKVNARIKKKREALMNQPWRLRMKVGEERKVILLDKVPYFMYEHQYESKPGIWNRFSRCIKEKGICPACDHLDREGNYVMQLTVIDLQPYKDKDGKTVKQSKKLMTIKSTMIPKYERIFKKNKESFRGLLLKLHRDSDKEPNTGGEIEVVKVLPESKLATFGDLAKPTDYEKAFPWPTEDELRQEFGGSRVAGSEDTDEDVEDVEWDDEDSEDGEPWDE